MLPPSGPALCVLTKILAGQALQGGGRLPFHLGGRVRVLENFEDGCEGVLTLANGRLIFSGSVLSHTFDVPVTSVADVAQNAAIGRSWYAFHIRFANNVIYNFAVVDENHRPQQPGSLIYRIAAAKRGQ